MKCTVHYKLEKSKWKPKKRVFNQSQLRKNQPKVRFINYNNLLRLSNLEDKFRKIIQEG